MDIVFYKNVSDNAVVNKNISQVATSTCELKQATSIINPTFRIKGMTLAQLATCNYCYVADFNRYYYINDINMGYGGIAEISCHSDVLMSNKSDFLPLSAIVERQENTFNTYLSDDNFLTNNKTMLHVHEFEKGLPSPQIYLLTM